MTKIEQESRLRREKDILDRIDNVKRLIEMEGTLLTVYGARQFASYSMTDRDGKRLGDITDTVLNQPCESAMARSVSALYGIAFQKSRLSMKGDEMEERTCRKCKHHICKDRDRFNSNAEWICINEDSHNYGDRTLSTERCPDFEARADK